MTPQEAEIPCPRCRASFPVPLEEMRPGNTCSCPHCGETIAFAGQDASRVLQAVEHLRSEVGDASIRVTVKTKVRRPWWKFW